MVRLAPLAMLLALLLCAAPALARPGDVDTSFGDGGQAILRTPSPYGSHVRGLAVQPDGGLLVSAAVLDTSGTGSASVIRFEPGGRLDRAFGDAGIARTAIGFAAEDPVLLPDGRIVLFGTVASATSQRAAVARLLPDGRLDPTFGSGGVATVPGGRQSSASGGVVQADGKPVVLAHVIWGPDGPEGAAAARLLQDGSPDPGFKGEDGWARVAAGDSSGYLSAGFQQPDGRLVLGGEFRPAGQPTGYEATLVRLEPDGSRDDSFGANGMAQGFFSGQGGLFGGIAVQPGGKLVLVGGVTQGGAPAFAVARANPDGSVDPSFGQSGSVVLRPPGSDAANPVATAANAVVVQTDGKLVISGNGAPPLTDNRILSTWAVTRLLPGGEVDTGFGDSGWNVMATGPAGRLWPRGLVRTPEGKVVVAGEAGDCGTGVIALVRIHAENPDADSERGPAMRTCDSVVEADRDGDLPIEVQCPIAEDLCRGSAKVTIPSNGLRVGARGFKLTGSETGTLRIRASARSRRYIARPRGVRAEIVYSARDGDGNRRVTRRKLRLKRAG